MTKEITKAVILQQIQDKFGLRDFEASRFLFDETVIPIYDIGQHLKNWESASINVNIASTGGKPIFTVPATERWLLRGYSPVFMTGTYTLAGVYILRKQRSDDSNFSYLDLEAGQSASYLNLLPTPVVLEPGDMLRVNVDGYTATGLLRVHYDFQREAIR